MHHHRSEHWIVVPGTAKITSGDNIFLLSENVSTYIPSSVVHTLENLSKVYFEIIELQPEAHLGEYDIVRHTDIYGRV